MHTRIATYSAGFTLIELLVVLLISAIIAIFAAPSMNDLLDRVAVNTTKDSIIEAIRSARVTAVEQKTTIEICGLTNDNNCGSDASSWDNGITIAERKPDNSLEILNTIKFKKSVYVKINGDTYTIYINKQGWTSGSADSVLVCRETGDNKYGQRIVLSRAGKTRTEPYTGSDWENSSGTKLNCNNT